MYSSDLLIAPRPVRIPALSALSSTSSTSPVSLRISSPSSQPDPSRLSPNPTSDTTSRSPRLSPRPSSEVLDEFFSILRPAIPSLFPTQPLPRFYNIPSLHDRALSLSSSGPASPPFSADGSKHTAAFLARTRSPGLDDNEEAEDGDVPTPLLSFGPQGSPISRIHTRNPFQRHPSYDYHSPSSTPKFSPRSPAMYPLPPPTPSELEVY